MTVFLCYGLTICVVNIRRGGDISTHFLKCVNVSINTFKCINTLKCINTFKKFIAVNILIVNNLDSLYRHAELKQKVTYTITNV